MMVIKEVSLPRGGPKIKVLELTVEEQHRLERVARHGPNSDGVLVPRFVNGSPKCTFCGDFYAKARATAGVDEPHLCCVCKQTYDHYFPVRRVIGSGHLANTGWGRDDHSRGHKARV